MYTILAYLSIFRIDELGVKAFRNLVKNQEPSKISFFLTYVFNKENLWNTHRSSWMKVKDLTFVEEKIIPKMEKYISSMQSLATELDQDALELINQENEKKEQAAKGEVGLKKTSKRPTTVPMSPRLTQTRPPILPEPERIDAEIHAKDVPSFIENTNLEKLTKQKLENRERVKEQTISKYSEKQLFSFTKREKENELKQTQEQTSSPTSLPPIPLGKATETSPEPLPKFYRPPPDFSKVDFQRDVKVNTAVIFKEDYLYRQRQEKDAKILLNYEEELRDPTEYYLWQEELKRNDELEKLKHVEMRREQAKNSSIEAKNALIKQKEDNLIIGSMIREHNELILKQTQLEKEIETLQKYEKNQNIREIRDTRPQQMKEEDLQKKKNLGQQVRERLKELREQIEKEREQEQIIKNDRIQQLKAINNIQKKYIKVFDPTETAKIGLLDEMSYLEMKKRNESNKIKEQRLIGFKNEEINQDKKKKQDVLEKKKEAILLARQLKREKNQELRQTKKEKEQEENEKIQQMNYENHLKVQKLLREKQEEKEEEQRLLREEEERIKRKQQYLGLAADQVAENRDRQIQMAMNRQMKKMEEEYQEYVQSKDLVTTKNKISKQTFQHEVQTKQRLKEEESKKMIQFEKSQSIQKIKDDILYKKNQFIVGQDQHQTTKETLRVTNPYATRISQEVLQTAKLKQTASTKQ